MLEICVLLIGLILIVFTAIWQSANNDFIKSADQVPDLCTKSWKTYELRGTSDGHVDDVYHVNLEYEYNGVKYTKLDYKDHMTDGKIYTIYVDKNNPEYIVTERDGLFFGDIDALLHGDVYK